MIRCCFTTILFLFIGYTQAAAQSNNKLFIKNYGLTPGVNTNSQQIILDDQQTVLVAIDPSTLVK